MGLIADVKQFFRGEDGDAQVAYVKGDLGGNDIVTPQHYEGSGVDSQPLPTDYMLVVPGPEVGTFVVAGYLDPLNAGTARAGEVSLYLRDGNGAVQGELYLASSEPDWKAAEGALIARADRVDAELAKIKTAHNTHNHPTAPDGPVSTPSASYTPAATGADKGWVT